MLKFGEIALFNMFEDYIKRNIPSTVENPGWFVKDLELKFLKFKIIFGLTTNPTKVIKNVPEFVQKVKVKVTEDINSTIEHSTEKQGKIAKNNEENFEFLVYFTETALSKHNIFSTYDMLYLFSYLNIPENIVNQWHKAILKEL